MKRLAGHTDRQQQQGTEVYDAMRISMPDHTIRIVRLKMLFVAANIHLIDFLDYLDRRRKDLRTAA